MAAWPKSKRPVLIRLDSGVFEYVVLYTLAVLEYGQLVTPSDVLPDSRVQRLDDGLDLVDRLCWHHVRLVQQDDIGEFDLVGQPIELAEGHTSQGRVDEQIRDVALVLWRDVDAVSVRQEIDSLEVVHEPRRIDHRNACVESSDFVQSSLGDELGKSGSRFGRLGRVLRQRLLDLLDRRVGQGVCELGSEGLGHLGRSALVQLGRPLALKETDLDGLGDTGALNDEVAVPSVILSRHD